MRGCYTTPSMNSPCNRFLRLREDDLHLFMATCTDLIQLLLKRETHGGLGKIALTSIEDDNLISVALPQLLDQVICTCLCSFLRS